MENKEVKRRVKKGLWKPEEDLILKTYVETHGEGNWATVSAKSGLMRGGKSCRLRWKNYLRPNIKRGEMSQEEEDLIIRMHKLLGNRWSLIAGRLPGRTDNEVKNYWNTHLNKRCHLGKRKTMNWNNNQEDNHENNNNNNNNNTSNNSNKSRNKRLRQLSNSGPAGNTSPRNAKQEPDGKQEDQSSVSDTWIQEALNMNYYIESPPTVAASNATFFSDDVPFIGQLDSFVLYESFGCGGDIFGMKY